MKTPAYFDAQNFSSDQQYFVDNLRLALDFPLHRHSFVELEYIKSGIGRNVVNGVNYNLHAGSVSLLMPWHVHELYTDKVDALNICKCSFRMDLLEKGNVLLKNINEIILSAGDYTPVVHLNEEQQLKFETIFNQLQSETRGAKKFKDEAVSALISQLVILFLRNASKSQSNEVTNWDIIKYVQTNFAKKDLTLEQVSVEFGYSVAQLCRVFSETVGITFGELLQEMRVRNAQYMLMYTDTPIETIAISVGYQSRSGLFEAFKRRKGISPMEYREQNKREKSPTSSLNYSFTYTKIIYYLHMHFAEEVTLDTIAKEFHYNKGYLAQLLTNDGTTFTDMLYDVRIYNACKLLLTTDLCIEEVALDVGFKSTETFYRAFKKLRNVTPKEYRRVNGPLQNDNYCDDNL